jgi:hypothetical protein
MLRQLKVLRSIIVNLGIIGVTLFSLLETSADPTLISGLGLLTLGLYNGVEVADYAALAQAFAEVKSENSQSDGDGSA